MLSFRSLTSLSLGVISLLSGYTAAQNTRQEWAALAQANGGIVKLNAKSFDALIRPDRDWSAVIQLTAMANQFKCAPCKQFAPSFDTVAKVWSKVPKNERDAHIFATLDFADGQEVFRRLGLNSAPFVNFYPATKGEFAPADKKKQKQWSYDFHAYEFNPETLARVLSDHTPVPIKYSAPIDYTPYITGAITVAAVAAVIKFFGGMLREIFISRWVWGFLSLTTIVTMISGFMFTKIRGTPFASYSKNGAVSWIAAGYQNQYGAETQVVGGLYSVLALSQIALIFFVPRLPSATRQQAAAVIWSAVMIMIFSLLLALFRQKNAGYPFKLLV